nr:MAG TPA: Exonuclease V [Caudoviricetes sp.]
MIMKIDKKNGKVCYNDEAHLYWNENDESKYISVTTLIHQFTQPFDKEFWSAYKALEKLVPKESWAMEKKSLLATKRFDTSILDLYDIPNKEFNKVQEEILSEWDKANKDSCERGTKIHAELENQYYKKPKNISLQKFGLGGKFECRKDYTNLDIENGVYPEYLIYMEDGILKVAGQIDLLIKNGNDIYIVDYKTNKKIDQKSGFDTTTKKNATMLYPLNNLMDCNYMHYTMQLSTYAYMLQKLNPEFVIKQLIMVHYDHDGKETIYNLDYLKEEVSRLFTFHKKNIVKEQQKAKRKRIEY